MKTKIFIAAMLAACLTSSEARIGETEVQIGARYGKTLKQNTDEDTNASFKMYASGDYSVGVFFMNGKSVGEMFMHRNQPVLTDAQVKHLMAINSPKEWLYVRTELDGTITWTIYGGSLWAQYQTPNHDLFIATRKFIEKGKSGREQKELAGLAGF